DSSCRPGLTLRHGGVASRECLVEGGDDGARWRGAVSEEAPMSDDRFEVQHLADESRFVLIDREAEGGAQVIGEERYLDVDGADDSTSPDARRERILLHTVVAPEYGGQGLASVLVKAVVEETIAAELAVVGVCPYVAKWLPKHPE